MDAISYKTISTNRHTAQKEWLVIDAQGMVLGRLASQVAAFIRGKHKPSFTPHADCGDNVIIINAEKIRLTGNKMDEKEYTSYTGYPGGFKITTPRRLMEKNPATIIEKAVRGMLPKNRLGRALFNNLYVYAGPTHQHEAQQPKAVTL